MRAQLHETLEKIAWEALGDVSERIVREAVARIEQVAWDVLPRLAETLIREEIRKLKGEDCVGEPHPCERHRKPGSSGRLRQAT
jgi:hypothetical protein